MTTVTVNVSADYANETPTNSSHSSSGLNDVFASVDIRGYGFALLELKNTGTNALAQLVIYGKAAGTSSFIPILDSASGDFLIETAVMMECIVDDDAVADPGLLPPNRAALIRLDVRGYPYIAVKAKSNGSTSLHAELHKVGGA